MVKLTARQTAAVCCWLGAAAVLIVGIIWYVTYMTGLDPDDPLYSESAAWAVILIGGGTFAATVVLAGAALLFSPEQRFLRRAYGWVLALSLLIAGVLVVEGVDRGMGLTLLLLSSVSLLVLWMTAAVKWEGRPALAAALLLLGGAALVAWTF
ncbi:MAG: hypothetical protein WEE64_09600 [Dehalococcoidia bacterium]